MPGRESIEGRHGNNSYGAIKEASIHNMEQIELNEGWNPQDPGLPVRWPARHVVAHSSCNGHVTEYSTSSSATWGHTAPFLTGVLAMTWDATREAHWEGLGGVGTYWCSLWSERGRTGVNP